ncbi:MAG: DUF1707 domain-containing protein [Solirubrobacterales bacterium]|nr:DUF1707 domain-containing protein [Solirubrobacterales bacterium]
MRASDADREQIAERLRKATAEGRLLAEELEERLDTTFSARTYGELDAVVADLPGTATRRPERRRPTPTSLNPIHVIALFILAPVIVSLLIAAAVIVATVFSAWGVLLVVGWLLFGRSRHAHWGPAHTYRRSLHAASRWPASRAPGPRPWI